MRQALSGVVLCLWRGVLLTALTVPLAAASSFSIAGEAAAEVVPPMASQWVYPVGSPTIAPNFGAGNANGYTITQGFNTSCDPTFGQGHYYAGYYFCGHTGVDLSANGSYGGVVRAAAGGLVMFAGPNGTYGNMVRIEHLLPDGHIVYSQYEHLAYYSVGVWPGEVVACGQQIGTVGDTGFAQGAHLHFEIKDSNSDGPGYTFGNPSLLAGYYDPLSFVAAHMPVPTPPPAPVATVVIAALPRVSPQPRPTAATGADGESADVLRRFLHSYAHFVTVTTPALRLRAGPSLHARQVGVVMAHTKLALLGVSGPWLRVALPQDVTGWVHSSFVSGTIPTGMLRPAHPARGGTTRTLAFHMRAQRPDLRRLGPLARVATAGVRVHTGPHLDARTLWLTQRGSMVAVRTLVGGWARVTFTDGTTGWMVAGYLQLPPSLLPHRHPAARKARPATRRAPAPPRPNLRRLGPLARVVGDGVHVRAAPQLAADVLFMAYRGSMVAVRDVRPGWARVTFTNGATGWMITDYLQMPGRRLPRRLVSPPLRAGPQPAFRTLPATALAFRAPRGDALIVAGSQPAFHPMPGSAPAPADGPPLAHPIPASLASVAVVLPAHGHGAPAAAAPVYYTWATTLYVRSAPRLGASVVGLAGENTPVRLLGTHVSWSQVRLPNGTEGWALSHYVRDHRKIYLTASARP